MRNMELEAVSIDQTIQELLCSLKRSRLQFKSMAIPDCAVEESK